MRNSLWNPGLGFWFSLQIPAASTALNAAKTSTDNVDTEVVNELWSSAVDDMVADTKEVSVSLHHRLF